MTRAGPIVRLASVDDADRIGHVHVRSWQAAYAGVIPDSFLNDLSIARRAAYWRDAIERAEHVWVVEVEGLVVGFAAVGAARDGDLPAGAGEVAAIYLDPPMWDQGLGRMLFAAAVDDLRTAGFDPLVLWVLADNERGRYFYEAARWAADGTARPIDIGGTSLEEIRYRPS